MVSSVVGMTSQQLQETLARFREQYADDPEYQELRQQFPESWPM
jgi:hypothetical protein